MLTPAPQAQADEYQKTWFTEYLVLAAGSTLSGERASHTLKGFPALCTQSTYSQQRRKNEEEVVCLEWRFYDRPSHFGTLGNQGC
jgi:hypothetical protein